MKYITLLLLLPATVFSQNCADKIEAARNSRKAGMYELSIKQYQAAAAAGCDNDERKVNIEDEILEVFIEIQKLKERADSATENAIKNRKRAEFLTTVAREERRKAEILKDIAENARIQEEKSKKIAIAKSDSLDKFTEKTRVLENTFSDTSTYHYLYETGVKHFEYDNKTQSRDYQNALTYFALARFLRPADSLGYWVSASKLGMQAEQHFKAGELDSAQLKYRAIQDSLKFIGKESKFEEQRLKEIKETESLFAAFKASHDKASTTVAPLTGNWWTLPKDFSQYSKIESIIFKSNPTNFIVFPSVLERLTNLKSISFEDCQNLQNISNWEQTPHLSSLNFKNNKNIYAINQLEGLPNLSNITVENCPAFTLIEGSKNLKSFATENSHQLRIAKLLLENKDLETLKLADLPESDLNLEYLQALQSLTLSNMDVENLEGLDKNKQLKTLKINQLNKLTAFTPPSQLAAISIANCKGLKNLDKWSANDNLSSISLFSNDSITLLPDWKNFSNLKTLVIVNARDVKHIKGTQTLSKAAGIYLINNASLRTNSIHAGFGFDWTLLQRFRPSSFKIEAEHRRMVKIFKRPLDAGFKAVAACFRRDFRFPEDKLSLKSKGFIGGVVITYYSPYWFYTGFGIGAARFDNQFVNKNPRQTTNLVWINNLGIQVAPCFLKKDKLSLNMDLYTVFVPKDYYILPSFGITYYKTLGFNKNTILLRSGDARRTVLFKDKNGTKRRIKIEDLFKEIGK